MNGLPIGRPLLRWRTWTVSALVGVASVLAAAEESVVARLEPKTITVGEQALVRLDVFGECAVDPEPILPEIDGLDIYVLAGPEFSVRSGGAAAGGQEYIASYRVGVVAERPGSYAIEGFGAVCQSARRIDANRVDLTAVRTGEAPPVRLRLEPSTDVVYARQPFRVRVHLDLDARVSNALTANSSRFVFPWWNDVVPLVDGTSLESGQGAQKRYEIDRANRSIYLDFSDRPREVDGVVYDALVAELVLLAPEAGTLGFEGTTFRSRLPRGVGTAVAGDTSGGRYEAVADVSPVTVREVPREGRPAGYASAIGALTIDAAVDRTSARVGDPIAVTLTIREAAPGTTNLSLAEFGGLDRTVGFRRFDHHSWYEDGARHVRLDLMAETPDVSEVPSFTIHWFDPESATFGSASTPAIPIEVTPHPTSRTLRDAPPSDEPGRALRLWPFGVILLFLGGLLELARRSRRGAAARTPDEDHQRSERRRGALPRLEAALAESSEPVDQARALARFLADRFDAEPGRCFGAEAARVVAAAGVDEDLARDVDAWFEAIERAAFANEDARPESVRSPLELARKLNRHPAT